MKKINNIGSYPSENPHRKGVTILDEGQTKIFNDMTKVLGYTHDEYDRLPYQYASVGLINILKDQLIAKLENRMLSKNLGDKVITLIDLLEMKLSSKVF